ncbi:bifunctional phosphoribosyl-AMP cyclohydrolase/phosphoribosyl-ATP diphosphatase HisIE [Legionella quateirensis]|uniref:Histidine biosynthesis bifunctional protein HisIE n=1 Tax=Legionella quateirensis TaxID=45072 RepID=A0A378KTP9_9GAMM|nr:bifunctional phosphoribosyl-AMP cyclohydrolase/phosphoribosyl-ATP diphosphatase HisIE [Legionella quateirensis]KTD43324.1 bifunctional phosphoribosyl-AMP cyclohydrolase/phosphoribosyl-ATP pyrophosphatase protein [Legionella quateirensis]STY18204.1 phosphoribosyl-ATP pyrophosphohydrolase [Legionella quateirensis]
MNDLELNALDWQKMNGLLPAIIQHAENGTVLMLGYMNQESLSATLSSGQLTLYSRSKQKLWLKGETSGNSMTIRHISTDCDKDSLLIHVIPKGPACHLGYTSCFQPPLTSTLGFLDGLIDLINDRARQNSSNSYTSQLLNEGLNKCAQKVGEEAVETVIAAVNRNREELINETADLIFHLLVLLKSCELSFYEVLQCLQDRDRSVHT